MKTEIFISKRIGNTQSSKQISSSVLKISTSAIALSVAIMLISISILVGFQNEITRKVIGFGAHISITGFSSNNSYELQPIDKQQVLLANLYNLPGVVNVQPVATKLGIIKTDTDLHGVVFKGVDNDYDWLFFQKHLEEGEIIRFDSTQRSDEVIISRRISDMLHLHIGDRMFMYFIRNNQPPSVRRFIIKGIYRTDLDEFDKQFLFGDIRHVQRLNKWDENHISSIELKISNIDSLDVLTREVHQRIALNYTEDAQQLWVSNIRENYPQIFQWLNLTDMNVIVILSIMIFVASVNMITGVLIFILEQTRLIGMFKAMGATNWFIRKVFIYHSVRVTLKGLWWGNLIGLALAFIQMQFHVIKLDPESYYVSSVPMELNLLHIFLLNIGTLLLISAAMLLPSYLVTKISPSKAIKFN